MLQPAIFGRSTPLFLIVSLAAVVRLWAIDFGLPHRECRPDESTLTNIALKFFTGDLNPHFFDYGTLYSYALATLYLAHYLIGRLSGAFLSAPQFIASAAYDWTPFFLISRLLAATLGVATVVVIHRLTRRIYEPRRAASLKACSTENLTAPRAARLKACPTENLTDADRAALAAAFFLSLSFLHARDSHFGVTDVPLTFLIVCSMLYITRGHIERRQQHFFAAGVFAGLAISTKYNAALLIVPLVASQALDIADRRGQHGQPFRFISAFSARLDWRLPMFLAPCLVAFFVGTPYALLDHEKFLADVGNVGARFQSHGIFSAAGWSSHLFVTLRYGVGWPLVFAALAGAIRLAARDWRRALLLCAFPLSYYLVSANSDTVFVRYMLPIVPFLCAAAGIFAVETASWIARSVGATRPQAIAALFSVVVIASSAYSLLRFNRLLGRTDNRLIAGAWIRENVPDSQSIYQPESYGQVQLDRGNQPGGHQQWTFDEGGIGFRLEGQKIGGTPDWIVLQESPLLLYSRTPHQVQQLVRDDYVRVRSFIAIDATEQANVFDQQDAFYLPIAGFKKIERPGPNFHVYRRKTLDGDVAKTPTVERRD